MAASGGLSLRVYRNRRGGSREVLPHARRHSWPAGILRRLFRQNIVIQPKQVLRIIFALERDKPIIVRAHPGADHIRLLLSRTGEIQIDATI